MSLKQRLPFLRWSFWRLAIGMPQHHQRPADRRRAGGGLRRLRGGQRPPRRRRRRASPRSTTSPTRSRILINVGDEKGELLDAAVRRADPGLALELGTYCGYSALRIARAAPTAQGVLGRVLGRQRRSRAAYLGARRRRRPGHLCGRHDRRRRTPRSMRWPTSTASRPARWTCCSSTTTRTRTWPTCTASSTAAGCIPASIVVADNVRMPGAPEVPRVHARAAGHAVATPSSTRPTSSTRRLMPDLVLESEYLG